MQLNLKRHGLVGALFIATVLILTGCTKMKVENFRGNEPVLILEDYFVGTTRAYGLFEDRFGTVRRQFTVDIEGEMIDGNLRLVEDFLYDDGEVEQRIWTLTRTGDNTYEGHAPGVVGIASGEIAGNAFNWRYTIDLKMGDSSWRVDFDDWMFLQPDGVLINRARVRKWGITIAEATIFFVKDGALNAGAPPAFAQYAAE